MEQCQGVDAHFEPTRRSGAAEADNDPFSRNSGPTYRDATEGASDLWIAWIRLRHRTPKAIRIGLLITAVIVVGAKLFDLQAALNTLLAAPLHINYSCWARQSSFAQLQLHIAYAFVGSVLACGKAFSAIAIPSSVTVVTVYATRRDVRERMRALGDAMELNKLIVVALVISLLAIAFLGAGARLQGVNCVTPAAGTRTAVSR